MMVIPLLTAYPGPPEGRGYKFRLQQILTGPRDRDKEQSENLPGSGRSRLQLQQWRNPQTRCNILRNYDLPCETTRSIDPLLPLGPVEAASDEGAILRSKFLGFLSNAHKQVPSSDEILGHTYCFQWRTSCHMPYSRKNPESHVSPARITFMDFCHSPFFRG